MDNSGEESQLAGSDTFLWNDFLTHTEMITKIISIISDSEWDVIEIEKARDLPLKKNWFDSRVSL
jgi:hypothetical protein